METLLNAFWLLVCAILIFAWRGHWLVQIRRRLHADAARQSFVSLVCLFALLFPAISLSDDLHPLVLALPDTKSSSVVALSHSQAPAPVTPHLLSSLPSVTVVHQPSPVAGLLAPVFIQVGASAFLSGPFTGRAPPQIS